MGKKKRKNNLLSRIKKIIMPFTRGSLFGVDRKAPKGFRSLPMLQAMVEFAEPIMEYVENGTLKDPNAALQIGMQIWNFTLPNVPSSQKPSRVEIVKQIHNTLPLDMQQAEEFFDRMLERKSYVFPPEIQPEGLMTMFMRKDAEYLITKFDESQLGISEEPIVADRDDQKLLTALRRMDKYIEKGVGYDEWEAHFFSMQNTCCARYGHWLKAKGVAQEYCQEFPQCVDVYLMFIYQYGAGDLRKVSPQAIEEFFMDFLMRKVMLKPPEYPPWPPALRLFYTFLFEKGYLDDPGAMINLLDEIESDFIGLIKKRS